MILFEGQKKYRSNNPKVARRKIMEIMFLLKCAVCDSKKSKFIEQQEADGLLSILGIKTIKIPLVRSILILTSQYKI